jgi:hypothetical protein
MNDVSDLMDTHCIDVKMAKRQISHFPNDILMCCSFFLDKHRYKKLKSASDDPFSLCDMAIMLKAFSFHMSINLRKPTRAHKCPLIIITCHQICMMELTNGIGLKP